jgi:uncharacterized phage protein (TIGR02218 family)
MTSMLERALTTLAFCWRLERRDGVCLGFTTHDAELLVGGLAYRPSPGLLPSAIAQEAGYGAAALDVSGALTSTAISADDLGAGRWDGAAVELFAVDWTDPAGERVVLAAGELGDVTVRDSAFEAELRGPASRLDAAASEQTSPECRAELGDRRCRVDLAARTLIARVEAVIGDEAIEVAGAAEAEGAYAGGRLRWLSGGNGGIARRVAESQGPRLVLAEPPPYPAAIGDLVELQEGCDKSFATCVGRFANAANFRGEPHLPGMDLLTRYPGAS